MQWSQIKTVFILSFLILNVYLLIQFLDKRDQEDLGLLDREESTIEEKLKNENIVIPKQLSDEQEKEPYLSVSQKVFNEEDIRQLDVLTNQQIAVINKSLILSIMEKPIKIPDDDLELIEGFVKKSFIYSEEYELWDWNKEVNVLIFFQKENNRPIYFNQSGMILAFLNDNNELIYYTQTLLGEADSLQDKKSLFKPLDAIEALYNANELRPRDEVTKVDIGFHTRVPSAEGVQVFVPAWKITVKTEDDERNYFVNAIEGFIFSSDESNFLEESIQLNIQRVQTMEEGSLKKEALKLLQDKLEVLNGVRLNEFTF
jgi:regulatory protein YycI of two-component signal transduction system YycFG